jgi:hypothetical protein
MMAAVTGVAFDATPPGSYGIGTAIQLRATFDEAIAVVGVPAIGLTIGTTARPATYISGSGSNSLLFSYRISAGDSDLNGIALAGAITLPAGGSIKSVADGSNAALTFTVPGSQFITVDGIAPVVSAVTRLSNATIRQGETIRYRVQVSEDALVTGTPVLPLVIGTKSRGAAYVSGSGTQFLTFEYTVASDDDGAGVPASLVSLNGGSITDRAGNGASLTFGPVAGFTVDVVPPTIVRLQSSTANGIYGRSAAIPVTATISEAVPAGSTISVLLDTGTTVVLTAAAQGVTLAGTYVVRSGDNTSDLTVSQVTGVATTDLAGNPLQPVVPSGLANIGGAKDIAINTAALPAPLLTLASDTGRSASDAITRVATVNIAGLATGVSWEFSFDNGGQWLPGSGSSFTLPEGSYLTGSIRVRQAYLGDTTNSNPEGVISSAVTIDLSTAPAPALQLAADTGRRDADGVTKAGSFTVSGLESNALWQFSIDGGATWAMGVGTSFTTPTGNYAIGRIQVRQIDVAGNVSAAAANAEPVVVDITGPVVTGVAQLNPAWLRQGDKAQFRVSFSEDVYVSGSLTIPLVIGTAQRSLTYVSGSGSRLLVFDYTISGSDVGLGVPGSIITLNGGALEDLAGNASGIAFGPAGGFTVDVAPPTIVRFQSSAPNGSYGQGAAIPITVTISETVPAGSTISVLLDTGAAVVLTAAAQGVTLAGTYVVRAGDSSPDLTVIQVASLATTDLAGNPLQPAVPSGLANVGGAKDIVVRPTGPTGISSVIDNVGTVRGVISHGSVTDDDRLLLRGTGIAGSTLIIRDGTAHIGSTRVRRDGTWSFTTPRLSAGTAHSFSAAALDMFGVPGMFSSAYTVTVDKAAPTVTGMTTTAAAGTYGEGDVIDLQFTFTEAVVVTGVPQVRLNTSPGRGATYVSGSGTPVLTFRYVIKQGDFSASLSAAGPTALRLDKATIRDAVGNAAFGRLSFSSTSLNTIVVDARKKATVG